MLFRSDVSDRLLEVLLRLTPALPEAAPTAIAPARPTRPGVGKETAA